MYPALDIAYYIIDRANEKNYANLNCYWLQKILYLVQAYFLIKTRKPCFPEPILKYDFGPVVQNVYDDLKKFGVGYIPKLTRQYVVPDRNRPCNFHVREYDPNDIRKRDRKRIDTVVDYFADYANPGLNRLVFGQDPFIQTRNGDVIGLDVIRNYFMAG